MYSGGNCYRSLKQQFMTLCIIKYKPTISCNKSQYKLGCTGIIICLEYSFADLLPIINFWQVSIYANILDTWSVCAMCAFRLWNTALYFCGRGLQLQMIFANDLSLKCQFLRITDTIDGFNFSLPFFYYHELWGIDIYGAV